MKLTKPSLLIIACVIATQAMIIYDLTKDLKRVIIYLLLGSSILASIIAVVKCIEIVAWITTIVKCIEKENEKCR